MTVILTKIIALNKTSFKHPLLYTIKWQATEGCFVVIDIRALSLQEKFIRKGIEKLYISKLDGFTNKKSKS